MKKALLFTIITLLISSMSFSESVGDQAYNLSVQDYNGNSQSIAKYRGKVILLKFWASWCGPCVRSLPKTVRLHKRYSSRGLVVFAVGLGGTSRDKAVLQRFGANFDVMADGRSYRSQIQSNFQFRGIPHELLISRTGKILFKGHPARLRESLIEQALSGNSGGSSNSGNGNNYSSGNNNGSSGNEGSNNADPDEKSTSKRPWRRR